MTAVFLDHNFSPSCLGIPTKEHSCLFLKLQNEPISRQYLARYMPLSEKSEEEWFDKSNTSKEDAVFVILEKPSMHPIGSMGLHHIDWKNRRAVTGAVMLEKYCNKGLGTSAKMLLLSWAFLELGLTKIESRVIAHNNRSKTYSEKCGYKEVGRLKRHHFRNGRWSDEIIMEVTLARWIPLWKKFFRK